MKAWKLQCCFHFSWIHTEISTVAMTSSAAVPKDWECSALAGVKPKAFCMPQKLSPGKMLSAVSGCCGHCYAAGLDVAPQQHML